MGDRKRPRDEEAELRRVAEMVMVLSALSQLRGGGDPTPADVSLVSEARKRLAAVCEVVRPKELFSSEAVRALVLDLGLNGSSDPLRPPRISIKDKVFLAKKKMEEIKDIPAHSSIYSTQNFLNAESPGTLYGNTRFHGALSGPQIPVTSASIKQQGSAVLHQTGQSPMVLQSQGATASFTFGGRTPVRAGNESLPQRSITASYMQSPFALASTSAAKIGETNVPNQLHDHTPLKVESSSNMTHQSSHQLSRNHDTKVAVQAGAENLPSGHHPPQGLVLGNASTASPDHKNIVQKIQNFLQGKVAVNPTWNPPSTKYIDEPLDCQICKLKITDVDNVLVCDACEKGNHLKCLQLYGNKNIPKQDWYCASCLTSNHGKPFPPKYCCVTRTHPAAQNVKPKKTDKPKTQSTQQGASVVSNVNPGVVRKINSDKNGATSCDLVNDPRINGTRDESGTDLSVTGKEQPICITTEHLHSDKKDHALCTTPVTEICPSESRNNEGLSGLSPVDMKVSSLPAQLQVVEESSIEQKSSLATETNHQPQTLPDLQQNSEKMSLTSIDTFTNDKSCDEVRKLQYGTGLSENLGADAARLGAQGDLPVTPNGELDVQNGTDCSRSPQADLPKVEWVGDIIEVVEERSYYPSCSIDGVLHKVQDHVLFSTGNYKPLPSKLQALWEDNASGSRFATVSPYYFPNDLPKTVEKPCNTENNEVYASKNCRDIMAGSIQGTCEVLQSDNFREKNKEMIESGTTNCSSYPILLCKWVYDDSNCNFKPFTS